MHHGKFSLKIIRGNLILEKISQIMILHELGIHKCIFVHLFLMY